MKTNKELILGILGIILVIIIFVAGNIMNNDKSSSEIGDLLSGKYYVDINVQDYGDIIVELDADIAPITVTNFINLVNEKFYDGLTFHRIMEGFMIQGGGYDTDGNKKEASTIKGEFSLNGVENNLSHTRGVISMARLSTDFDSASSEFFIMHADNYYLDGGYAAFGYVISGMDVVDNIATSANPTDDNGSIALDERPVITSIRVIDVATSDIDETDGD